MFIGTGAEKPRCLGIQGESLGNVHFGLNYLANPAAHPLGNTVAVIGMGNAATPFGLSAMDEMQKLQTGDVPTQEMILFVVMNTASFQLIPSAAVTLRASYGSADPYDVLPHIWLVSFGSLLVCVLMCRVFRKLWRA